MHIELDERQKAKRVVIDYYRALDGSKTEDIGDVLDRFCATDLRWQGYHPFNELNGTKAVAQEFWGPLLTVLKSPQRRLDLFFAGRNEIDGFQSTWVASMGHLMGLFDQPWIGIPATGKIAMLRYAAFHKVENDKITETAMFFDIPHLMAQAGFNPFPTQTGAFLTQPGPSGHDGLLLDVQDTAEGTQTLAAINFMINDIKNWTGGRVESLESELRRSWNDDMIWWGPTGIGATYTIERYAKQHAGPFRAAFSDRQFNGHLCRMAEGKLGGFFGWPNLTLTHTGQFMGRSSTGKTGDMRVIDMYRRDGDKLTENWVFIDLLHFWKQIGWDILAELPERTKNG